VSILHFCNVFFEWELAGLCTGTLEEAVEQHLVFRQLQYLPLTYGHSGEGVLASQKPDIPTSLPVYTFDEAPPFTHLETWGYSLLAKEWAEKKGLQYAMPPWDIVKMVNSKTYSFSKSPLPGARLIFRGDPIEKGTILKSCFGTAGRGLIAAESEKAKAFCEEEWSRNLPVISEPFVDRICDFSTQWLISRGGEIAYIGSTICKTTKMGMHKSNIAQKKPPSFLDEHKVFVTEVLEEIALMGYFGPVGFDAMVYGDHKLQPIVEINARKTMGLIALVLQREKYPGNDVEFAYLPAKDQLLPNIKITI